MNAAEIVEMMALPDRISLDQAITALEAAISMGADTSIEGMTPTQYCQMLDSGYVISISDQPDGAGPVIRYDHAGDAWGHIVFSRGPIPPRRCARNVLVT